MDVKELLQTRYMVVNPFSGCNFNRYYEIFTEPNDNLIKIIEWHGCSLTLPTDKMFVKLKWWQARAMSDMPKHIKTMSYVGCHRNNDINKDEFIVYEVEEYTSSGFTTNNVTYYWDTQNFQPSTKEEYDYYQIGHKAYGEYWDNIYNKKK